MSDHFLKEKLRNAKSIEEVRGLVKGQTGLDPEQIWQEIEAHRSNKSELLDLNELEAVSGGADRDWKKNGCAAVQKSPSSLLPPRLTSCTVDPMSNP